MTERYSAVQAARQLVMERERHPLFGPEPAKTVEGRFEQARERLDRARDRLASAQTELIAAERQYADASRDYMTERFPSGPVR